MSLTPKALNLSARVLRHGGLPWERESTFNLTQKGLQRTMEPFQGKPMILGSYPG